MAPNKIFQNALLISLAIHGIILCRHSGLHIFTAKNIEKEKIEVSYFKNAPEKQQHPKAPTVLREPLPRLPSKITVEKTSPPSFADRDNIFKKSREIISPQPNLSKPTITKPDIIAVKKRITLPPIDIDKINNPSYISYYQIVREKIKRAAYQNYTRTEIGEVYLSFLISNDGKLEGMRLIEEKSTFSPYLRDIASKSIKDASPFPAFPKDLEYLKLSFNVAISFEIE